MDTITLRMPSDLLQQVDIAVAGVNVTRANAGEPRLNRSAAIREGIKDWIVKNGK